MNLVEIESSLFMDRSTVLYGASGTGKSTLIRDILYCMREQIDQIQVVAPSNKENGFYTGSRGAGGMVPAPCVHDDITEEWLNKIWERQSSFASIYTSTNDVEILGSIARKFGSPELKGKISKIKDELAKIEDSKDYEEMRGAADAAIVEIYKSWIVKNRDSLISMVKKDNGDKNELLVVRYCGINPRIILVFDDCTTELKKLSTSKVLRDIFYRGRWAYITTIIACHTDKTIDAEIRKNVWMSVFTDPQTAHAFFSRGSNDIEKKDKLDAEHAISVTFYDNYKLAWMRGANGGPQFGKLRAAPSRNFRFGSDAIWKYCEKITAKVKTPSVDNMYTHKFMRDL